MSRAYQRAITEAEAKEAEVQEAKRAAQEGRPQPAGSAPQQEPGGWTLPSWWVDPAKLPSAAGSSHNGGLHDAKPRPSSGMIAAPAHAQHWTVEMSRNLNNLPRGAPLARQERCTAAGTWCVPFADLR